VWSNSGWLISEAVLHLLLTMLGPKVTSIFEDIAKKELTSAFIQ
nr:hypothetical protein [Tanacetum cinerariifolium]